MCCVSIENVLAVGFRADRLNPSGYGVAFDYVEFLRIWYDPCFNKNVGKYIIT